MASLITVSAPDASRNVTITGAPGAIPGLARQTEKDWLRIMAIDWGTETCVRYSLDGSFVTQLAASPGTTIILAAVNENRGRSQRIESTAAAIIRVAEGVDYTASSMPFSVSGYDTAWHWLAQGEPAGSSSYHRVHPSRRAARTGASCPGCTSTVYLTRQESTRAR